MDSWFKTEELRSSVVWKSVSGANTNVINLKYSIFFRERLYQMFKQYEKIPGVDFGLVHYGSDLCKTTLSLKQH